MRQHYIVVEDSNSRVFERAINEAYDAGYRAKHFTTNDDTYCALMELTHNPNYNRMGVRKEEYTYSVKDKDNQK